MGDGMSIAPITVGPPEGEGSFASSLVFALSQRVVGYLCASLNGRLPVNSHDLVGSIALCN
jgi:hypothetical protein